jgi:hypothetical protein
VATDHDRYDELDRTLAVLDEFETTLQQHDTPLGAAVRTYMETVRPAATYAQQVIDELTRELAPATPETSPPPPPDPDDEVPF